MTRIAISTTTADRHGVNPLRQAQSWLRRASLCMAASIAAAATLMTTSLHAQNSSLLRSPSPRQHVQRVSLTLPTLPATTLPATTLPATTLHATTGTAMQLRPPAQLASDGHNHPAPPESYGGNRAANRRPDPYAVESLPPLPAGTRQMVRAGYAESPPVMLDAASWTYQPAPPLRVFQKNDVVTIRVDEIARVLAEGNVDQRKRTLYNAIITDWIKISKFRVRPDPQEDGEPAVGARSRSTFRADSSVESRESMTFNIAATVVDIRPNGNLVLEARKAIRINDNLWETSLSGICRAQDIGPDNVVLSKDMIDLEINKGDRGQVRDGYKRGWMQRWLDRYGPF